MTVCPAKTQISLGIWPVWTESLLCAQWAAKDPSFLHADSEGSDQTGQMPRLIWVFVGRTCHFVGFVMRRLRSTLPLTYITHVWHASSIWVGMIQGQSLSIWGLGLGEMACLELLVTSSRALVYHLSWLVWGCQKSLNSEALSGHDCSSIFDRDMKSQTNKWTR